MENEEIKIKKWLMKILGFNDPTASGSETEYLLSCAENAKNLRDSIASFEENRPEEKLCIATSTTYWRSHVDQDPFLELPTGGLPGQIYDPQHPEKGWHYYEENDEENETKTPKIVSNVITESPLEKSTYWQGHGEFFENGKIKIIGDGCYADVDKKIYELETKIYELEKKTIRLETLFKLSGFYIAVIYAVFLIIGHLAHWL